MIGTGVPRRTVLQSGAALAAPFVFAGLLPQVARASPLAPQAGEKLSGMLVGWVTVDADHGATLRIVRLDAATGQPTELATAVMPHDPAQTSLRLICQRAQAIMVERVVKSWDVSAAECAASPGRIAFAPQGREVSYAVWVDIG